MTWVVPLALGGLAILVMAFFTMQGARRRHRAHVAPATVVGPRVLIHDINDDRCTGCDACVAVCPTNVLDLVSNKSRVLRFQDCIQCEACMYACPTEALVMFPEGAVPPPLKCPEIDENFQTIVPGQYLIGEVSGKPLVKNAANLGRMVVEHILTTGIQTGALGRADSTVDVVIVGSGPGGVSAALTCVQRGLSYVVLEKEQTIASTIMRYPKGKLVMAEPYDTVNLSLLPIMDSSKEALIPIWQELLQRAQVAIKLGESVESVKRGDDGVFETRTTVGSYKSQRVILSIGTRGKPRTLQVPGENLPKVYSLLEDPDDWKGKAVLIVGGGDSACEAAMALADSGARVMISYRGKSFARAAPKNKQAIENYAAEGRIKAKLGSQVLGFDQDSVTLALADGEQKKYPNDACFTLIGADPPVAWLEKLGVKFVERPHQYQTGKTDDLVRRFVARAMECPEDAARAAAQVLGGTVGPAPAPTLPKGPIQKPGFTLAGLMMPMGGPMTGPRKWLRSATSIFSNKTNPGIERSGVSLTNSGMFNPANPGNPGNPGSPATDVPSSRDGNGGRKKKLDAPMPLSEFAARQKSGVTHSGNGRRDQLTAGERTRILRMLRDEGGRMADEDSLVYVGTAPPLPNDAFDFGDESPPPPMRPQTRPKTGSGLAGIPQRDIPAKPAVVVGLAQAKARSKKPTSERAAQPAQPSPRRSPTGAPPRQKDRTEPPATRPAGPSASAPPAPAQANRRPAFADDATREVAPEMLAALRMPPPPMPTMSTMPTMSPDLPTLDEGPRTVAMVLPASVLAPVTLDDLDASRSGDASRAPMHLSPAMLDIEDNSDEATKMASVESMAALERAAPKSAQNSQSPASPPSPPGPPGPPIPPGPPPPARGNGRTANARPPLTAGHDERTRAVDIRSDKSMSDIDWDID